MDGDAAEGGAVGAASNDAAAAAAAGIGAADAVGMSGFDSTGIVGVDPADAGAIGFGNTGFIGLDPGAALSLAQEMQGINPAEAAMMAQPTAVNPGFSSGFTQADLASLQAAGLGSMQGVNPNNPTQSVDEAIAVGNFAAYGVPIMMSLVPGASLAMNLGQLAQGLQTGAISPGQALTGFAVTAAANQLGISPSLMSNVVNGNFGAAAAQTAMGAVNNALSAATGLPASITGLGLAATGLPAAISAATAQEGVTNLGQLASALDNSLSGMGLSLGSSTTGSSSTTGAFGMADATTNAPDYLTAILGIGANLIATDMTTSATSDAAARSGAAAREAAAIQAAAAADVRNIQQELRAPYTTLGQTAAQQYAAGIAPGGQFARPFSMQDAQNTQAMRLAQQEAAAATEQSAASRGGLLSANTQEALQKRAAQIGAQYQNQAFNQYLQQQNLLMRPLELGLQVGAGQAGAQAGAESEAQMTAGQGAANAIMAEAGLMSGADIAAAQGRSNLITSSLDQLIRAGLIRPGAGSNVAPAPVSNVPNLAPVVDRSTVSDSIYSLVPAGSSNYFGDSSTISGPGISSGSGSGYGYSLVPNVPSTSSNLYDFSGSTVRFGG